MHKNNNERPDLVKIAQNLTPMEIHSTQGTDVQQYKEVQYENYRIWKKNSLVLYDLCLSHVLAYPALCLDFQPQPLVHAGQARVIVAFGTNTPVQEAREQNYVYVKQLILPSSKHEMDQRDIHIARNRDVYAGPAQMDAILASIDLPGNAYSSQGILIGGYSSLHGQPQQFGRLHDDFQVSCPLEANALCFVDTEPEELAVLLDDRLVMVDLSALEAGRCNTWAPKHDFNDSDGGFALDSRGHLLVHGGLTCVTVYDLKTKQKIYQSPQAGAVNSVSLSPFYEEALVYVTDDGEIVVTDVFQRKELLHQLLGDIEDGFVGTSVSFDQYNESVVYIGSSDGRVMGYDLHQRKVLFCEQKHQNAIYQLRVSPHFQGLIATGSEDGRVKLHFVRQVVGLNQQFKGEFDSSQNQGENFELKTVFVHAGHTTAVTDVRFHQLVPNLVASSAEDNSIQFWWPSEKAFNIDNK